MNLPREFQERMQHLLRQEYEAFIESYHREQVQALRVNTLKITEEELQAISSFELRQIPWVQSGFYYAGQDRPGKHPYHEAGLYYIQEPSAMAVGELADARPGEYVLDLCAAPGGKSFAAAIALSNTGSVTSCDPNPSRLRLITDGAARLGLENISTVVNRGEVFNEQLKKYNVIICDVPCSGIGIIPKKPDLRYKSMQEVQSLAELQYDILSTAKEYLADKGTIVYSTCTINKMENEQVIDRFLKENSNFELVKQQCPVQGAVNCEEKVTFLSHLTGFDGFFVAVLRKMW